MELRIQSRRWQRSLPDWPAAVGSGLVAGAVLMVLELLWSATVPATVSVGNPWRISHSIAALVLGPDALQGPWARDRVYSRALTIAGGTTQVNKNIVATRILGLPRH